MASLSIAPGYWGVSEQRALRGRTSGQFGESVEGDVSMASESIHPASAPSRRVVVAAVGAAGLALTLNACGSEDDPSPAASDAAGAGAGSALAKTSDIPEGGGKIFKDSGVVVTQPTAGEFKAFSSKCTHQGCAVSGITNGVITCPCHK